LQTDRKHTYIMVDTKTFSRERWDADQVNLMALFKEALKTYKQGTMVLKIPRTQREHERHIACDGSMKKWMEFLKQYCHGKLQWLSGWDGCGYITLPQIIVEYLRESTTCAEKIDM